MPRAVWRILATGLFLLVPTWATFLILSTLFWSLDDLLVQASGRQLPLHNIPGLGLTVLVVFVMTVGAVATHVIGKGVIARFEQRLEQIPLVRSVYLTIKGMTDILNFRSRFGQRTVVAFPFPRDGLWALGFIMGEAPAALQVSPTGTLMMVFVPTAIHPFTGYLAFVPATQVRPLSLAAEDAMKMEFSAGFYKPENGWLQPPSS